jgi:AcrR family transcriptional regulator
MASKRRMGPENSAVRVALMDAVECVMRDKGYGALSARTVAEQAGLKHQLVYYYYLTIEDLLLATYRRRTAQVMDQVEAALRSERPLAALWDAYSDPNDAALTLEYLALSNHSDVIKAETAAFGERLRLTGLGNIAAMTMPTRTGDKPINPLALTSVLRSVGAILGMEAALGIAGGHRETRELVQLLLSELEPARDAEAVAPPAPATGSS